MLVRGYARQAAAAATPLFLLMAAAAVSEPQQDSPGRTAGVDANAAEADAVRETGASQMHLYAIRGSVSAKKIPKWSAELDPVTLRGSPSGKYHVTVSAFATDGDNEPAKKVFAKVEVTLYAIDKKGKQKKLGKKQATANDDDGGAQVEFNGAKRPGSHYRVAVKVIGGKVSKTGLLYLAAASNPAVTRVTAAEGLRVALRALREAASPQE